MSYHDQSHVACVESQHTWLCVRALPAGLCAQAGPAGWWPETPGDLRRFARRLQELADLWEIGHTQPELEASE